MGASNTKGDIAELAVAKDLLEAGYIVCPVWGDDAPYDLIVDINDELKRVQVKYVTEKNGTLSVQLTSSGGIGYKDTVDIIAIYCPDTDCVYYVPIEEILSSSTFGLRLRETKNNQTKGVKMASNYMRV